jgi:hypothetical protein
MPNDPTNINARWTATQSLTPAQQTMLDRNNNLSIGLLGTANNGLQYANQVLSRPGVDLSSLPSTGISPGQSYQGAMMTQLQPQIDRSNNFLTAQLANQGVTQGSEAWKNAWQQQNQNINNLYAQATTAGMNMGLNANNQAFNQRAYNQMQPINMINALRTGSQVQMPNYVNPAQQATTSGADLLGATNDLYSTQLGNVNAHNAQAANTASGVGAAALAALAMY